MPISVTQRLKMEFQRKYKMYSLKVLKNYSTQGVRQDPLNVENIQKKPKIMME